MLVFSAFFFCKVCALEGAPQVTAEAFIALINGSALCCRYDNGVTGKILAWWNVFGCQSQTH